MAGTGTVKLQVAQADLVVTISSCMCGAQGILGLQIVILHALSSTLPCGLGKSTILCTASSTLVAFRIPSALNKVCCACAEH